MAETGFGIVGCGKVARKHAQALRAISGARLRAVHDIDPSRAAVFAESYGAKSYRELEDLLGGPAVNIVSICTPSGLHARLGVRVAQAGKHVLVEKPLALTTADCNAVTTAARAAGVKLAVVHPNRFLPNVAALKRAVETDAFGRLSHAAAVVRWHRPAVYYSSAPWRGTRAMDGGVLFNQAIHNIDLLLWMMGEVTEVVGRTATRIRPMEAEDVAVAAIRFRNGALGVVEASVTVYPENLEETLAIFGESGTAVLGGRTIGQRVRTWRFQDAAVPAPNAKQASPQWGHRQVIADLLAAVRAGRDPVVTGEEATKAVSLVEAILASEEARKP